MKSSIRFHFHLQTLLLISFSVATVSIRVSSHEAIRTNRNLHDSSDDTIDDSHSSEHQKHYANLTNQIMILLTTSICFMLMFFCCIRMIVSYNGGMQEEDIQAKSHEEIIAELNGVQRRQLLDLVLNPKRFVEYKNMPREDDNDIEMSNHDDQEDKQSEAPVTPPRVKNLKDEEMDTPPTVQMRTPSPKLRISNRKGGKGKYEALPPDSPGGCLGSSEDTQLVEEEEEEERLPNVPSLRSKQEKESDFVKSLSPTIVSTLQPRPQTAKVDGNNLELEPRMAAALAHPLSDLVQKVETVNNVDNSDDEAWDDTTNMCAICLDDYGKYFHSIM